MDNFQKGIENCEAQDWKMLRLDAAGCATHDFSHHTFTSGQNSHPSFVFPELSVHTSPGGTTEFRVAFAPVSLAGELLKGHKERCLTNLGTPKGLARPGFKTGVLVTESSHGPHIVCSIQYILLFVSLFLLLSTFHVPEISELPNFLLHYLPEQVEL